MSQYIGLDPRYINHITKSFTSDGTTTTFNIGINPGSPNSILVNQDGVIQRPVLDYTTQGANLVFSIAPPAAEIGVTDNIFVVFLGIANQINSPADNTVTTAALQPQSVTLGKLAASLLASAGQAQSFTNSTTLLTPLGLGSALQGANQLMNADGFQKFPGGLILQWGTSSSRTPFTFPTPFITAKYITVGMHIGSLTSVNIISDSTYNSNLTSDNFLDNNTIAVTVKWISIGI